MDKMDVLKVLIQEYRETERGKMPTLDFCDGHDKAILRVAYALFGMSKGEFYILDDKTR